MGKNFNQVLSALRELGDDAKVQITLVTNQDNMIVSYATGKLVYQHGSLPIEIGQSGRMEKLETWQSEPLQYLF